jgi:predicted transcriptional regulator of viral defense system
LTQHKRRGSRSLSILRDREEAPTLYFKGSKPEAVPAGWNLFFVPAARFRHEVRTTGAGRSDTIGGMPDANSLFHLTAEKRSSSEPDRLLASLAEKQHGVVERRQLVAIGLGRGAIDARLRRGVLHQIHRGVYAVGHRLVGIDGRRVAAVLAAGHDAVLSHRSAARTWRLLAGTGGAIEVTRTRGWRAPASVVVHQLPLLDDETVVISGIPVTSVSRTLLDLAAVLSKRQLERAMNEAEVLRLTDRLSLPDLLERYPRRRGTAVLRTLLRDDAASPGVTVKELEERFVAFVDRHGLPQPRRNADIAAQGRFFRVDCLWPEQRVIVELDGRAVHGTREAFEKDRERDRILLAEDGG